MPFRLPSKALTWTGFSAPRNCDGSWVEKPKGNNGFTTGGLSASGRWLALVSVSQGSERSLSVLGCHAHRPGQPPGRNSLLESAIATGVGSGSCTSSVSFPSLVQLGTFAFRRPLAGGRPPLAQSLLSFGFSLGQKNAGSPESERFLRCVSHGLGEVRKKKKRHTLICVR